MIDTIPISILELAIISQDSTATATFEKTKELAQLVDSLGYKRFWLAELIIWRTLPVQPLWF